MIERKINENKIQMIEEAIEILMENGNLFFEDYQGKISPISYCDVDKDKIIFKE